MTKISITSLGKSVRSFARKLREGGYSVGIGTYKSGNWGGCGNSPAEPSSVKLWVRKNGGLVTVTFLAGGWPGTSNNQFGGDRWSEMKKGAMAHINKHLPETRRGTIKYTIGNSPDASRRQITLNIPIIDGCVNQGFCRRAIADRHGNASALIFNFKIYWK